MKARDRNLSCENFHLALDSGDEKYDRITFVTVITVMSVAIDV